MSEHNSNYETSAAAARKMLTKLDWMPGYPGYSQMEFLAEAVAAFADDRLQYWDEVAQTWLLVSDRQKPPIEALCPLRWLLQQVARRCAHFPPPIKMRQIYEERFTPSDGRAAFELTASLEQIDGPPASNKT